MRPGIKLGKCRAGVDNEESGTGNSNIISGYVVTVDSKETEKEKH